MPADRRLLLFAYFFPPLGGPAVQRPLKLVKYLSRLGWTVDVITVKGLLYHSTDTSLIREAGKGRVIRTPSADPMYLLNLLGKTSALPSDKIYFGASSSLKKFIRHLYPIDEKIGWVPFAWKAGMKAVLTNRYQAVMITGNPFSACLAALAVAKKAHLPLIVDYRDHWTLNNTIEQPTGWLYTMHQALERYIVKQAALITTATRTIQADLQKAFAPLPDNKFQVYYNGWDEEDFIDKYRQPRNDNHITLSYLGTLYTDRKLAALLSALKAVSTTYPKIRLRLVGNFFPETIAEVKESGIGHLVEFIPQQNHAAAIQMMLDSDLLLLVIGDAKLKWVLTGKLFEYLRSQRPILALAPGDGEAAEILNACGHSSICDINDPKAIETALLQLVASASNNSFSFSIPHQFERKNQIKLFEEKLSCIAK